MNIFGYNCNGVKMEGDTYQLNTTLCWVIMISFFNTYTFIASKCLGLPYINLDGFIEGPDKGEKF